MRTNDQNKTQEEPLTGIEQMHFHYGTKALDCLGELDSPCLVAVFSNGGSDVYILADKVCKLTAEQKSQFSKALYTFLSSPL